MKKITTFTALVMMSVAVLTGCGDQIRVEGVQIMPDTVELSVGLTGQTEQLELSFLPVEATDKTVTWSSDNAAVATVSDAGLVTAVGAGTTNIKVTTKDGKKTDTCEVSVLSVSSAEAAGIVVKTILYPGIATAGVVSDFNLITEQSHLGYEFDIRHTAVNDPEGIGYTDTYIAISEDGSVCEITPPNALDVAEDFYAKSKLTATVFYNDVSTEVAKDFNVKINPMYPISRLSALYAAANGTGYLGKVAFDAYYVGQYSANAYQGVFLADGDYGIMLYGLTAAKIPAGLTTDTIVRVVGTAKLYSGVYEIDPVTMVKVMDPEEVGEVDEPTTLALNDSTVLAFNLLSRKVTLTGTVATTDKGVRGDGSSRSGITLTVSTGTKTYTVYVHKTNCAAAEVTAFTALNVGDTVDLDGYLGIYSPNYQVINPHYISSSTPAA